MHRENTTKFERSVYLSQANRKVGIQFRQLARLLLIAMHNTQITPPRPELQSIIFCVFKADSTAYAHKYILAFMRTIL